tara:strand:+ start:788 stop:1423 length:636 start_codon:yes stop_codon:yes gene_type:complete
VNGQKILKINKRKFIYLISPNKINKQFYKNLEKVLKSKKIKFFQLRLKKSSTKDLIKIGKKIKPICKKNNVKFIINDNPLICEKVNADGFHLGQSDISIENARLLSKNKLIGITCHNSKRLAKKAKINNADYIAFGAFFKSKTKYVKYFAKVELLKWAKKNLKIPIIAIGGINEKNYKEILKCGANYVAFSSYIWRNKSLTPIKAISKINY